MQQQLIARATAMLCCVLLGFGAGSAVAQTSPTRHLVYDFTVGVSSSDVSQNNAIQQDNMSLNGDPLKGPGFADQATMATDKGQIMVDVNGVRPDGGLVVTVWEAARTNRSEGPVTCVVYPDTRELCSAADVRPEEQTVLRALSPTFFDAGNLDANHHWQVSHASTGLKIEFAANPGTDGVKVAITSQRVQRATNGGSVVANATYAYDTSKLLPTEMSEYQTTRQQNGVGAYSTATVETTATLVSDSGLAKS